MFTNVTRLHLAVGDTDTTLALIKHQLEECRPQDLVQITMLLAQRQVLRNQRVQMCNQLYDMQHPIMIGYGVGDDRR